VSGFYERLGVRRAINGAATLTRLGGSLMPPPVLDAMREAAESFVDVQDLQAKAGKRLAELTRNEAAYVSCGAATGLLLATASCITGPDEEKVRSFVDGTWRGQRDEVIIHRAQRNAYDLAIRTLGARVVEIGTAESTGLDELRDAFTPRTIAVFYFAGALARTSLSLDTVIDEAHRRGVPVVVDAAAQIPPPDNLWNFTAMGADLVLFSGGKGLRGPQSSGLMVGRRDLIAACAMHGAPNHAVGRPMKVGKEEIAGLVAAVEHYLSLDHDAIMAQYERQVRNVVERMTGLPGVAARRDFPNEAGQPMPRVRIDFDETAGGPVASNLVRQLEEGDPPIYVSSARPNGIFVNPQTLEEGQEIIIADRLRALIAVPATSR